MADTVAAACGLAAPDVVEGVVREGISAVQELVEWGASFDTSPDGSLHFTREGGHDRPRILHAADRTGREIERVLLERAASFQNITALPETFAIDLISRDDQCCGAVVYRPTGVLQSIWARRVILATGGAGRLYRETTNPAVTTGDGLAMAFRAGATLQDLEFIQFHPTTLYVAGSDRFLITEAVRGEGGLLVDRNGEAFMSRFHPRAELAPRDVVSRSILTRMKETGDNKVYLDMTGMPPNETRQRFPYIRKICANFGIDIERDPIPVRPSAHYTIGGVRVDADGATNVVGLYAAGEVSSTGLHGANRLGSNSLLEGLVFGRRAGVRAARECAVEEKRLMPFEPENHDPALESPEARINTADLQRSLQSLLWYRAGIERNGKDLETALKQAEEWISYILPVNFQEPQGWTLQNMLTTAYCILTGALAREESRGVHFRADFPESRDAWNHHQTICNTVGTSDNP